MKIREDKILRLDKALACESHRNEAEINVYFTMFELGDWS